MLYSQRCWQHVSARVFTWWWQRKTRGLNQPALLFSLQTLNLLKVWNVKQSIFKLQWNLSATDYLELNIFQHSCIENTRSSAAAVLTTGWGLTCQEVGGTFHRLHYSTVAPLSPIYTVAVKLARLAHWTWWILVHHLSHVTQNILLGADAQETPGQTQGK